MTSGTLFAALLAGALAGSAAFSVSAQDKPIEFRLAAAKGNLSDCMRLDASLSRVHTITLMGETASIKSAGGINDTLKQKTARVYTTTFNMGGVRLDVVADASTTPRTLKVTDTNAGCRWDAIAP